MSTRSLATLLTLAALAGCGGDTASGSSTPPAAATSKPAAPKPAAPKPAPSPVEQAKQAAGATQAQLDQTGADAAAAMAELNSVPSQEAADAQAAQQITDANADAEFAKLQKELEADKP